MWIDDDWCKSLRNHEVFFPPVSTLEKPRFVGVPGKLPSILQSMRESYWNKRKPIWRISQSFHDQQAAFGNATCGNLRVWGSWCWTGRLPSRSRTRHWGTLLVTVVRFCPLVESLLSWYKSYVHVQSHTIISCYSVIYIYHIILSTDYYILIYIIWLGLYVSYIIFNYWLLYLNQPHFFTKNPPTIINHPKHRHGTGRGTREPLRKCRQVHFRESSEWLAATSQVARYENYKIKEWRSHLVMRVANKLRWRIDILNLCFPSFCLLQHCYLSKGLGLKLLDFPSTWRVRAVLRRKIFATRSCAVEDFLKQHRPWGVTFLFLDVAL